MGRTDWLSPNPSESLIAQTLEEVQLVVQPVFDTITTILELTETVLTAASSLLVDLSDPNTIAIKGFIETIRAVLDDLAGEDGAGVFMISIPIVPIDKVLADKVLYPEPGKADMNAQQALETAVREGRIGSGGNYGFLSTLKESMVDSADPMRPQLDEDAHVAGVLFYFGSEAYLKLVSLVFKLAQLFSGKDKTSGVADAFTGGAVDLPRPRNLTAELVTSTETNAVRETLENSVRGDSNTPLAVLLSWDIEDRVHVTPWPTEDAQGQVTLQLEEVVVYRSDRPIPTTMDPAQRSRYAIARYPFSGWSAEFYDESINTGQTYHYAVGYKIVEQDPEDPEETIESLGVDPTAISNTQITVPENTNMFSRRGTPPDWFVFPSPLALIPAVTQTVATIQANIDAIEKTIDDKAAKTRKYIEGIADLITYYTNLSQEIVDTVNQFINALNWTGLYSGVVGFSGKGGNARVLKEIGDALFDTSDPKRPPFDRGTEAVTGFVIFAGSATVGKLDSFKTLINTLWNVNVDSVTDVAAVAVNAWEEASNSIDAAIAEIRERICLADNLSSLIDCTEEQVTAATMTFSNDMQPDTDGDTSCTGN